MGNGSSRGLAMTYFLNSQAVIYYIPNSHSRDTNHGHGHS